MIRVSKTRGCVLGHRGGGGGKRRFADRCGEEGGTVCKALYSKIGGVKCSGSERGML